jgi:hypothetical protein
MTDPITVAVVGSLTSQVAKGAADWLKSRGPEISEEEWMIVGYQIGNELLAIQQQHAESPTVLNKLESEVRSAWQAYDELARVGDDFEFDEEFIQHYRELATACNNWAMGLELNDTDRIHGDEFKETIEEYKSDALPHMR